jgi:hypothetical protein
VLDRMAAALCLQLEQLSPGEPGFTHVGYKEPALTFHTCTSATTATTTTTTAAGTTTTTPTADQPLPAVCDRLNRKIE